MTTGAATIESGASAARPPLWRRPIDGPPGRWFHAILVLPTVVLLWSHTVPGAEFVPWFFSVVALLILAVAWFVRVVVFLALKRRWSWWLAVAPLCGVVVLGLIVVDAPLRARWAIAEPSFVAAYQSMQVAPPPSSDPLDRIDRSDPDLPTRIGTYAVLGGTRDEDGAVFWLDSGCFLFCWGGFAYVPPGESTVDEVFDDQGGTPTTLTPLGDGWYAWVVVD